MSEFNRPEFSGSLPKPLGRLATPPRTLPSQLDDSIPLLLDSRPVPFSPTSPGKRSPGRPKTMKEYEEDIVDLKRENFNLKVRIYFLEQNRLDSNLPKDIDELRNLYTDLKVEYELQKKDLASKEDLLLNTYRALDVQKQQLEAMKTEHEAEKLELHRRIDCLEKELKDYCLKFMETSVQMDDTNAMYAITFGLNSKPEANKDLVFEEKIQELENEVAKEKERALMLEDKIVMLNEKIAEDQKNLLHVEEKVHLLDGKLVKALKEKKIYEDTVEEITQQKIVLEKNLHMKYQTLSQKETEIKSLQNIIKELEDQQFSVTSKLQKRDESAAQADTEMQKQMKNLYLDNKKLKQEIRQLFEDRSSARHVRDRSASRRSSERERELVQQLKDAQGKIEELQKEIEGLKNNKTRYRQCHVEDVIQTLVKENKVLRNQNVELKQAINQKQRGTLSESCKEEVEKRIQELNKEMASEKDSLIMELRNKIEELSKLVYEKECKLQEFKTKLENISTNTDNGNAKLEFDQRVLETLKQDKEQETITNELEERKKEVEKLKKELRKRTYNLQGLVNTELWDKNREIEKLNKAYERQHLENLTLQKQLREYKQPLGQDKVTAFVSPMSLPNGLFNKDKENLQPLTDPQKQLHQLNEEKRALMVKVEELQARLLNTPERDTESSLVQTLRAEKDETEKLRKEAVNACMLLTTRLQELADFLDSLLPSLCGRKRKVVQQAVERSRELSRSLSLAAEESTVHCSAWTDLQPSLYVPLLPDISTVDFWSGDECQEEPFTDGEEVARLKSQVETLTEEVKQKDGEIARFQSEKNFNDILLSKSIFSEQNLMNSTENGKHLDDNGFHGNTLDFIEGPLIETCSDRNVLDHTPVTKLSSEVKSANIGKITLTSRKKSPSNVSAVVEAKGNGRDGGVSEYETWSEPDRDVSFARMGLKEDSMIINKPIPFNVGDTTETADSVPKSPSSRRSSEIQRLHRKVNSLEQVNEALRSELIIMHQLTPPALTRQDKATSVELSRQSLFGVPSHLLEEIRNQREKLEASLFHNDYIRRQLESTVSSVQRSQGDDQERALFARLKEVMNQFEVAEREVTELKVEKESLNGKLAGLQTTLEQSANKLTEKQSALQELEIKSAQRLNEVEEKCKEKCLQIEDKYLQMEDKCRNLQNDKSLLLEKISEADRQICKLSAEIEKYEHEGKKNKQLQDDLNLQLQQINRQKENLQHVVSEQEQLLADAERERQELATQLIARDHQVSELQKQLSHMEVTGSELEAALRTQLDVATRQCSQFEAKIRDLDSCNQEAVIELRRRLDAARFAHSEAVLQYTRLTNDNIKLQQELRRHQPNQVAQVERIKAELESRVAELEVVNAELETRLASLNVMKPSYSDCETDTGSGVMRSPRRTCPPPLALPSSPPRYETQRSHDHTSDYLSDQETALSSPQAQTRSMWFPMSPHPQISASPDLGIESDHGRFSSLESHAQKSSMLSLRGTPVNDLVKLEEENTQLRRNLQKTRHALEETLAQLTSANQHKRQYEAQLSAANQQKAKVERAICRQLHKTHTILKKARVNLEEDKQGEYH